MTGFGIVLSSDGGLEFGQMVRIHNQTNLAAWIDIAETNAGPRWVNNPNTQLYDINGDQFEGSPFVALLDDYQIVSVISDYEDSTVEGTISQFNGGGRNGMVTGEPAIIHLS